MSIYAHESMTCPRCCEDIAEGDEVFQFAERYYCSRDCADEEYEARCADDEDSW